VKTILALRKTLQVVIHSGSGSPTAMQVHMPSLVGWLTTLMLVLLILGAGSLLFFRELEINRKLQSRLLVFETDEKLWQTSWNNQIARNEGVAAKPQATLTTSAPTVAPVAERSVNTETPAVVASTTAVAKISELASACTGEECQVRLSMSTTGTGMAHGYLLIVMEAEVPRIGANTTPEAQMRKRYFFYPNQEPREELEPNSIAKLEHSAFRFGRALKTTANFKVGKLLRPLSVNAYLFDDKHALLQHERRAITEEP
jgi:hypothetical protein